MGCARPLLLAVGGEARRLAESAGCGYIAPPEDVSAMTAAILRAKSNPAEARARGQSGRRFVEQHFDRVDLADRYLDDLIELVGRGRA